MYLAKMAPHKIVKLIIDDIAPINYSSLSDYSPLAIEHLNIADALLHTDLQQFVRREEIEQSWVNNIPEADTRRFLLKNIQHINKNRFSWKINIQAIVQNLPNILNGIDGLGLDIRCTNNESGSIY